MNTPLIGSDYGPLLSVESGLWLGIAMMVCAGVIVGALAIMLTRERAPSGVAATLGVGVAGALAAGLAGRNLGWYGAAETVSVIASVVGAIAMVTLYREVSRSLTGATS